MNTFLSHTLLLQLFQFSKIIFRWVGCEFSTQYFTSRSPREYSAGLFLPLTSNSLNIQSGSRNFHRRNETGDADEELLFSGHNLHFVRIPRESEKVREGPFHFSCSDFTLDHF